MHASVVNLEGLSRRALALPPQARAVLGPAGEARRARPTVPCQHAGGQATQIADSGVPHKPAHPRPWEPGFFDTPPLHPCTLPGSEAARRTLPIQQSEACHVFRHDDAPRKEPSINLIRHHHSLRHSSRHGELQRRPTA